MIFSPPPPWRLPCAGAPGGDRLVARLLLGLLEGLKLTLQVVLRDRGEDLVEVCGSTALTWCLRASCTLDWRTALGAHPPAPWPRDRWGRERRASAREVLVPRRSVDYYM